MPPPLRTVLLDLAHERLVHTSYDMVPQRLYLEPVNSFIAEDLATDPNSSEEIEEHSSPDTDDLISLMIGQPPISFKANKHRMCTLSTYLNNVISSHVLNTIEPGTTTEPEPALAKFTICMPSENPLSFEIILNWTITHTFIEPETESAYFYTRLLEAYFLAERLDMPVICHAILIELHDRAPDGLMDCHGFVYANTAPESPLRRMLVGMAVHDMRVAGVFQKGPLYGMHNPEFMLDLKNELVEKSRSRHATYNFPNPNISQNSG